MGTLVMQSPQHPITTTTTTHTNTFQRVRAGRRRVLPRHRTAISPALPAAHHHPHADHQGICTGE
jgi:hypothetical protein